MWLDPQIEFIRPPSVHGHWIHSNSGLVGIVDANKSEPLDPPSEDLGCKALATGHFALQIDSKCNAR